MASLIEAVKRQALITFSNKLSALSFEENLTKLKLLASKVTSNDVQLDKSLLSTNIKSGCEPKRNWEHKLAPVTYIEVFENPDVTIGIFVVRSGARLPLHDHPFMYGILKVIYGTVHICSYSPVQTTGSEKGDEGTHIKGDPLQLSCEMEPAKLIYKPLLFAVKEPEMLLCEKDEACVLCPRQGNIHEIHSVDGPAAFLDILAPPYESDIPGVGPRPCQYFMDVTTNSDSAVKKLVRIPNPTDYWSDTAPYQGPSCDSE